MTHPTLDPSNPRPVQTLTRPSLYSLSQPHGVGCGNFLRHGSICDLLHFVSVLHRLKCPALEACFDLFHFLSVLHQWDVQHEVPGLCHRQRYPMPGGLELRFSNNDYMSFLFSVVGVFTQRHHQEIDNAIDTDQVSTRRSIMPLSHYHARQSHGVGLRQLSHYRSVKSPLCLIPLN